MILVTIVLEFAAQGRIYRGALGPANWLSAATTIVVTVTPAKHFTARRDASESDSDWSNYGSPCQLDARGTARVADNVVSNSAGQLVYVL